MEKKILVCDKCEKQIATMKCETCHKDMCSDCECESHAELGGFYIGNLKICRDCYSKFEKARSMPQTLRGDSRDNAIEKNVKIYEKALELMKTIMTKEIMTQGLKDEGVANG